jgi:hypothetical protein
MKLAIILLGLTTAALAQQPKPVKEDPTPTPPAREECHNPDPERMACVTYKVVGAPNIKRVEVHFANAHGDTESYEVAMPWTLEFAAPIGQWVHFSARNIDSYYTDSAKGWMKAAIYINGQVINADTTTTSGTVGARGFVRPPKVESSISFGGIAEKGKEPKAPAAVQYTRWSKEGGTQEQFMKDRYECLKEAKQPNGGFACGISSACLGARGYTADPEGKLRVPPGMEVQCTR